MGAVAFAIFAFVLCGLAGALVLLGGPARVPGSPFHPAATDPPPSTRSDSTPAVPAPGQTVSTLTLFNDTRHVGNFLPARATNPVASAYDSRNGTVWFTAVNEVGVANATTGVGLRYLPIQFEPWGLAYDNRSDRIFVAQYTSSSSHANVSVFNATSYQSLGNVSVGLSPEGVAYDWQTDQIFVADNSATSLYENVSVVNATSLVVESSVHVGSGASGVAFDPSDHLIAVTNHGSDNLSLIDPTARTIAGTVSFVAGGAPQSVVFDPQDDRLYVTGSSSGVVGVVDPTTMQEVGNITLSPDPYGIAVDPASSTLYVSDDASGQVWYIQTNGNIVEGSVNLSSHAFPNSVTYDPAGQLVFVTCSDAFYYGSSNVTVISAQTNTTVRSIGIEYLPGAEAYSDVHHAIFVYDGGSGRVDEINDTTEQLEASVFVGYTPHTIEFYSGGLALDPLSDGLYVDYSNGLTQGVDFVDLATMAVTHRFPTADFNAPAGIVFDAQDNRTFVVNSNGDNVTVIDAKTNVVLGGTPAGYRPLGGAFDPLTDQVYVANLFDEYLTVLDGSNGTFVTNVSVGVAPMSVAFDPTNQELYVADSGGTNLTVVNGTQRASVASIGLNRFPAYPNWVAYDATNNTVEVTGSAGAGLEPGYLGIVNGSNQSFAGAIEVGTTPGDVVFDPAVDRTFVSDYFPGSISVVSLGAAGSPPPLEVSSLTANPPTIRLGQSTDLITATTGGTPPLDYAYSTLPPGCVTSNLATLPCTPTAAGTFPVGVNVTDAASGHGAGTALVTVLAPSGSFQVQLNAAPATIPLGRSTNLTSVPLGGTAPYSYVYQGMPTGCHSSNVSTLPCTPNETGTSSIDVVVTEANGSMATNTTTLTVTAGVGSFQVLLVADPSTVVVGQASELVVTTTGGTPPFSYAFSALPPGCSSANTSRLACTPTQSGAFEPAVTVTDARGALQSATTHLTVTAGGTPVASAGGTSSWWWILLAIVAVMLILFFFFVARRRKKDRVEPVPPPTPASGGVPSTPPTRSP